MTNSSSLSTGPQGGIGAGKRDGGAPEPTSFERDKLPTSGLHPSSQTVGNFVVDGPSAAGEVTIKKGGAVLQAVRELSQEVEKEPLPVELREQVRRFYDSLAEGEKTEGEKTGGTKIGGERAEGDTTEGEE